MVSPTKNVHYTRNDMLLLGECGRYIRKKEVRRLPLGVPSGIRTHDIQNHNLTL